MAGALEGVRYLDLARVGPGGHCSRILADMGADVIRVAEPAPSAARRAALPANDARTYSLRRNTRVIGLDLKSETGRAVFYRLAATADAMGVGFRPGTPKRLGVDYETMAKVNSRLVYCSMTGYGATGPYAGYAGHDINYQALAGLAALNGDPHHKPHPAGTIGDAAGGGMQGVIGILAAIVARDRTGRGQFVDAGATDGLLNLVHRWFEMEHETGVPVTRGSEMTLRKYAWYDTYETKDGKYVSVGAVEPYFYANLCRALGREDFIDHQYDDDRIEEMRAAFAAIFRTRTRDEWTADLMPTDCCVAPVYEIGELAGDPHFQSRGAFADYERPSGGRARQAAPMTKFGGTPSVIESLEPKLGDFTHDILASAGYTPPEIEALLATGSVT